MDNKLKYLKNRINPTVFEFIDANKEQIGKKLLVWVGQKLNGQYNDLSEQLKRRDISDEEKKSLEMAFQTLFSGILIEGQTPNNRRIVNLMEGVKYIEDWFNATSPNISTMGIAEAYQESEAWHKKISEIQENINYKKMDDERDIVYRYLDMVVVDVHKKHDLVVEGDRMGHCVGRAGYYDKLNEKNHIYSVRDSKNEPHVTMEINNGKMVQCKGKQNHAPVAKYVPIVILFVLENNIDISDCSDIANFPNEVEIWNDEIKEFEIYDIHKFEIIEERVLE